MCVGAVRSQKRASETLQLELQMVASCLSCEPSGYAADSPNSYTLSSNASTPSLLYRPTLKYLLMRMNISMKVCEGETTVTG